MWISCFDIGGTTIKYGLCTEEGVLVERDEMPTEIKEIGPEGMIEKIADRVRIHQSSHDVEAFAIGAGGFCRNIFEIFQDIGYQFPVDGEQRVWGIGDMVCIHIA